MGHREIIAALIHLCVANEIISQADLIEICNQECGSVGIDTQTEQQKKRVADYLNSVKAVSLNNLSNVMRNRGIRVRCKATLDRCLSVGCFAYCQRQMGRLYYVKGNKWTKVTTDMIFLKDK